MLGEMLTWMLIQFMFNQIMKTIEVLVLGKTIYPIDSKAWIESIENCGNYVPYNFSCRGVRPYLQIHENIVLPNLFKYMCTGLTHVGYQFGLNLKNYF